MSSLLLCLLCSCGVQNKALGEGSSVASQKYRMVVTFPTGQISGIMAIKHTEEMIYGTAINEFGVKLFDFVISGKKCKLKNVASMMNKWYIKRTIAGDLHTLFTEQLNIYESSDIELVNDKRGIIYKLSKLGE